MQVGIMSGHIARPTLEEALDAILAHDIRHIQFNWSSLGLKGKLNLVEKIAAGGTRVREESWVQGRNGEKEHVCGCRGR